MAYSSALFKWKSALIRRKLSQKQVVFWWCLNLRVNRLHQSDVLIRNKTNILNRCVRVPQSSGCRLRADGSGWMWHARCETVMDGSSELWPLTDPAPPTRVYRGVDVLTRATTAESGTPPPWRSDSSRPTIYRTWSRKFYLAPSRSNICRT